MNRTALILSGRLVSPTMESELGALPPVFLSVAGTVLLEHQARMIEEAGGAKRKLLTLPESYEMTPWQARLVQDLGFEVLPLPSEFSIGEAILLSMVGAGITDGPLAILYGDTLFSGLDLSNEDFVSVGAAPNAGHWAVLTQVSREIGDHTPNRELVTGFVEDGTTPVISGFFNFSSVAALLRAIAVEHYDYLGAIVRYDSERSLDFSSRGKWYDFGRPRTYFESRRDFTTERHFNNLTIENHTVAKTSRQSQKVGAEAHWFEQIPPALHKYTPAYLGRIEGENGSESGYLLEYLHMLPLNDCYAHLNLPIGSWRAAISACFEFLSECRQHQGDPKADLVNLYGKKTFERLNSFCDQRGLDPDHNWVLNGAPTGSFNSIVEKALSKIDPAGSACIMHGDLCFSNILLDTRTARIRVIDPRGAIDLENPSIYGDQRYDMAKLYHSFVGQYDLILAQRASLREEAPYVVNFEIETTSYHETVSDLFLQAMKDCDVVDIKTIHAITVLLFVSMTPLHVDRPLRQMQLAMNALRLSQSL